MRKIAAMLILLCAGMAYAAYAEIQRPSLTVGPVLSWGYADIYEYVFNYSPSTQQKTKLSELDWDVHNSLSAGVRADFNFSRFSFSVSGLSAFTSETGLMQDMDWLYVTVSDNGITPDYPLDTMTEFSEHEITLKKRSTFNAHVSLSLFKGKKFSLAPLIGFQYNNTYMLGHDGYLQHSFYANKTKYEITNSVISPYDPNRERHPCSNVVISYRQQIESLWLGFAINYKPADTFCLSFDAACSPFQMMDAYDQHFSPVIEQGVLVYQNNYVLYHDEPEFALMMQANLLLQYMPFESNGFVLSGGVLYSPIAYGNTYVNNGYDPVGLGGTGYLGWDVSLSYRIRIF